MTQKMSISKKISVIKKKTRIFEILYNILSFIIIQKEWEWLTFLGCIIVIKCRKQGNFNLFVCSNAITSIESNLEEF